MISGTVEPIDLNQPQLILIGGGSGRKCRPIDRDVLAVGRAPGCDIGIDARDIAELHCLIHRGPNGLSVRNCSHRSATRLNGEAVQESVLHDGDVLQVGLFSFRVHLPASSAWAACVAVGKKRFQRLEQARRNLARLALAKRRRLMTGRSPSPPAPDLEPPVTVMVPLEEPPRTVPVDDLFPEESRRLKIRAEELNCWAEHLKRKREALDREKDNIAELYAGIETRTKERLESERELEQKVRDFEARERETNARFERERDELAKADAVLHDFERQVRENQAEQEAAAAEWEARHASLREAEALLHEQRRDMAETLETLREAQRNLFGTVSRSAGNGRREWQQVNA